MKRFATILAVLLLCSTAFGQITITGPTEIQPNVYNRYDVGGLTEAQLIAAKLDYSPTEGVILFPVKSWGGEPFILLMAQKPCTININISLNSWRQTLQRSIAEADKANVEDAIVDTIKQADKQAEEKYPFGEGAVAILVKDPAPPKPKPEPTPSGKYDVVVFYSSDQLRDMPKEQNAVLNSDKLREAMKAEGHTFLQAFEDDVFTEGIDVKFKPFVEAVKGQATPLVVVRDKETGEIKFKPLPASPDAMLALLKEWK